MDSPYRGTFRIKGFRFGKGKKSLCIVGSMRGDEIQQQYICSQLVRKLAALERENKITDGNEILIIPTCNPFSMNIEKRFWAMDNTDINRMFPGYEMGETTQRIADAVFKSIQDYQFGIQMASFYMPGDFIPHVRMLKTGYEQADIALKFRLPYVCIRKPKPFDTVLLNYNWQLWGAAAFSIYAGQTNEVCQESSTKTIQAVLRFMNETRLIEYNSYERGYNSVVLDEEELISVKANTAGIYNAIRNAHDEVREGEVIAQILDPYNGELLEQVTSPADGTIFFAHNKPLALQGTPLFKIVDR